MREREQQDDKGEPSKPSRQDHASEKDDNNAEQKGGNESSRAEVRVCGLRSCPGVIQEHPIFLKRISQSLEFAQPQYNHCYYYKCNQCKQEYVKNAHTFLYDILNDKKSTIPYITCIDNCKGRVTKNGFYAGKKFIEFYGEKLQRYRCNLCHKRYIEINKENITNSEIEGFIADPPHLERPITESYQYYYGSARADLDVLPLYEETRDASYHDAQQQQSMAAHNFGDMTSDNRQQLEQAYLRLQLRHVYEMQRFMQADHNHNPDPVHAVFGHQSMGAYIIPGATRDYADADDRFSQNNSTESDSNQEQEMHDDEGPLDLTMKHAVSDS